MSKSRKFSLSGYLVIWLSRLVNCILGGSLVSISLYFICVSLAAFAQEQFVYDSKGKRNPFIPLVTSDGKLLKLNSEKTNSKGLLLEGIIYDKNGISYAIVNGTIVKTGDLVDDKTQVLKIEKNKVILIKEGNISEVELRKEGE